MSKIQTKKKTHVPSSSQTDFSPLLILDLEVKLRLFLKVLCPIRALFFSFLFGRGGTFLFAPLPPGSATEDTANV